MLMFYAGFAACTVLFVIMITLILALGKKSKEDGIEYQTKHMDLVIATHKAFEVRAAAEAETAKALIEIATAIKDVKEKADTGLLQMLCDGDVKMELKNNES